MCVCVCVHTNVLPDIDVSVHEFQCSETWKLVATQGQLLCLCGIEQTVCAIMAVVSIQQYKWLEFSYVEIEREGE